MINAIRDFDSLIKQTEIAGGLFDYLDDRKVPIDASDLLRWEWVLAVSALDKYVHDIVRIGMIQQFLGLRPTTDKYKAFRIDMRTYTDLFNSQDNSLEAQIQFEKEIVRQHKHLSFQNPDNISDALSFVWTEKHKWQYICKNMIEPISVEDLKTKLNNIVMRRNQIVHEGDCIISRALERQSIEKSDVTDVIEFIKSLVHAIHDSV